MFISKYIMTTIVALLTLTLFDSNPWWIVVLYSALTTTLNFSLKAKIHANVFITAVTQGVSASVLAYLLGLTPFFRTTFGTLVGFALLLSLAEYLLVKFTH